MAMEIIRGRPTARGVTELMYVGDIEQLDQVCQADCAVIDLGRLAFALGAAGLFAERDRAAARGEKTTYTTIAAYYALYRAVFG